MTIEEIRKYKGYYKWQKWYSKTRVDRNGDPIGWEFTFDTWFKVWLDSGKLHLRGTKAGQYVMARKNDIGPYSVDNVDIILHSDNIKFAKSYWAGPSEEVKAHIKYMRQFQVFDEQARKNMSEAQTRRHARNREMREIDR